MKVRMLVSMAGVDFALSPGDVTERFGDEEATRLVQADYAVVIAAGAETIVQVPMGEVRSGVGGEGADPADQPAGEGDPLAAPASDGGPPAASDAQPVAEEADPAAQSEGEGEPPAAPAGDDEPSATSDAQPEAEAAAPAAQSAGEGEPPAAPAEANDADDKAALQVEAEALGVDVDKRWGVARLKSEIEAAKAKAAG